jgi:hypothetical protein
VAPRYHGKEGSSFQLVSHISCPDDSGRQAQSLDEEEFSIVRRDTTFYYYYSRISRGLQRLLAVERAPPRFAGAECVSIPGIG